MPFLYCRIAAFITFNCQQSKEEQCKDLSGTVSNAPSDLRKEAGDVVKYLHKA